jgi:hypothetical protein
MTDLNKEKSSNFKSFKKMFGRRKGSSVAGKSKSKSSSSSSSPVEAEQP